MTVQSGPATESQSGAPGERKLPITVLWSQVGGGADSPLADGSHGGLILTGCHISHCNHFFRWSISMRIGDDVARIRIPPTSSGESGIGNPYPSEAASGGRRSSAHRQGWRPMHLRQALGCRQGPVQVAVAGCRWWSSTGGRGVGRDGPVLDLFSDPQPEDRSAAHSTVRALTTLSPSSRPAKDR